MISTFLKGFLFAFFFFVQVKVNAEIQVAQEPTPPETKTEISIPKPSTIKPSVNEMVNKKRDEEITRAIHKAVQPVDPTKEIVILNTESGFVPDKIRVKKGEAYKVHIVNLNMKEKNVSFLMDSFSQTHNTVYGIVKTFNIEPQVEGIYSYQCPETGIQGQLVVIKDAVIGKKKSKYESVKEDSSNF